MECHFPAGPLIGDVTFTQKANSTIDVVATTTTTQPGSARRGGDFSHGL